MIENVSLKELHVESSAVVACACVAKSWFLSFCLMHNYDKNGYLSRIQQVISNLCFYN
jgi:hypothetical protein